MADSSHADDIVTRYIQRVSELSQRQKQLPQQSELEAIALELGMDASDLKLAQAEAYACLQRARTYKRVGRWEDAIAEFERAALVPITDPEVLLDWAQAHKGRYEEIKSQDNREQAQKLARQCLAIAPDSRPAALLLNELDMLATSSPREASSSQAVPAAQKNKSKSQNGDLVRFASGLGVAGAIAGAAAFSYLNPTEQGTQPTSAPPPISIPSNPTTSAPPPSSTNTTSNASTQGTATIPAEFVPAANAAGLSLETRNSALTRYSTSTFYKAAFSLTNNTKQEISEADAQLEYLDNNGNVLHVKEVKLIGLLNATLRPGDQQPVAVINSQSQVPQLDKLASVRLKTTHLKTAPAAASYPPSPVGKFAWVVSQPPGADIKIGIRNEAVSSYGNGATNYLKLVLEVTNTGSVNLEKLKLQVEVFDDQDQSLVTRPMFVSATTQPPLLSGETRLVKTTISVPRSPQKYRLTVVQAESS
ncbi:MAG: tetratricopeptide repeat protein [Cyanobacteria bacterium P01_D01_bin.73]